MPRGDVGAPDRSGRAVEGREEPVTPGVDLHTSDLPEQGPHRNAVGCEKLAPAPVSE